MGLDTQIEIPKFEETIFSTPNKDVLIPFKLDKWVIPHPNATCYIVTLPVPPRAGLLDRVVSIARDVTLQLGSPDDLDIVPDIRQIPIDPVLYKFTHALEHLAVANLAIRNASVLAKLQEGPAGKTTVYREMGQDRYFVGFSLTAGLPPTPSHELTSIKTACTVVANLQS